MTDGDTRLCHVHYSGMRIDSNKCKQYESSVRPAVVEHYSTMHCRAGHAVICMQTFNAHHSRHASAKVKLRVSRHLILIGRHALPRSCCRLAGQQRAGMLCHCYAPRFVLASGLQIDHVCMSTETLQQRYASMRTQRGMATCTSTCSSMTCDGNLASSPVQAWLSMIYAMYASGWALSSAHRHRDGAFGDVANPAAGTTRAAGSSREGHPVIRAHHLPMVHEARQPPCTTGATHEGEWFRMGTG